MVPDVVSELSVGGCGLRSLMLCLSLVWMWLMVPDVASELSVDVAYGP